MEIEGFYDHKNYFMVDIASDCWHGLTIALAIFGYGISMRFFEKK